MSENLSPSNVDLQCCCRSPPPHGVMKTMCCASRKDDKKALTWKMLPRRACKHLLSTLNKLYQQLLEGESGPHAASFHCSVMNN